MPVAYGLIEPVDLSLTSLPAALNGLRVAHLSDLHIRRPRPWHRRLSDQLAKVRVDIAVLTGDYMTHPGDEPIALQVMTRLLERLKPRLGAFGVFGNHDSTQFRREARALPVTWLNDEAVAVAGQPLDVLGLEISRSRQGDAVALATRVADRTDGDFHSDRLRILLAHYPSTAFTAADLRVHVMFAGHTHGGQIRLPGGRAVINSTDLPLELTSGVMRHRDMLLCVTRGLGTISLPVRLFCRPHVPLYTLRRGPAPGRSTDTLVNLQPW